MSNITGSDCDGGYSTCGTIFGLEMHVWAQIWGGIFTLGSIIASFWIIVLHFKNYTEPTIQRYMIRIVFMIPIYAFSSWLDLMFKDQSFYFTLVRDCYEAYVLYMFFRLLIELSDGEEALVQKLEQVSQMRCSCPMCCMHIKPGRIFMHRCKQMLLQFVVLKPIMAVAIFLMEILDVYDEGNFAANRGYLYITIIYNVSFTLALYFLFLFYEATKDILKQFRPIEKFLCIKAVIFFSYWQSIAIAVLIHMNLWIKASGDWTLGDVAMGINNFLICVEMFPLAVLHARSFGYASFKAAHTHELLYEPTVMQRIVDAANITDVLWETVVALKKGPQRKVYIADFMEIERSEQRKRVVKSGWLSKRGEDLAKIWKTRFICLINNPKGIVYFKKDVFAPENEHIPLKARGFVDFREVTGVKTHKKTSDTTRFQVRTDARKWHFRAKNKQERDEWMEAIQDILNTIPPKLVDVDISIDEPSKYEGIRLSTSNE